MTTAAARKKEDTLGIASKAAKQIEEWVPAADVVSMKQELKDAPSQYKKAITSIMREDVFGGIEPFFPILLKKQTDELHMGVAQLANELDLILNMGNIRDPASNVYVYSLQVVEPSDLSERLDRRVFESFATVGTVTELMNGYVRHDLLYELSTSYRNLVIASLLQHARKIRISIKPPWSAYRIDSMVRLQDS
jgi:hypothetical protein